jgi:signal transduction histidine kinase
VSDPETQREELRRLLSHELRTPLTTIIGYLELLASAETGPLNDEQQRMLARIDSNATRLLQVVEIALGVDDDAVLRPGPWAQGSATG